MKPALAVMAKAPEPGRTKTRLCPPLTPEQAADVYAACAQDVIENALAVPDVEVFIAVTPPDGRAYFERAAPGAMVLPVAEATIGRCLQTVLSNLLARGHPRVVAISSDSPDLWPDIIAHGFAQLEQSDVVFGPSADGGYYLVGLRRPAPELFVDEIAWSTPAVLAQSLARAEAAGLRARLLDDAVTDVDTIEDLARLRQALTRYPPRRARHIRAALERPGLTLPAGH